MLTEASLAAAERQLGVRLPGLLVSWLREQNGGYIRYSLPGSVHSTVAGIGPHFPSLLDFDWTEARELVGFELDGLVPFDGDGHWHLCLDYRKGRSEPAVTLVDLELDREEPVAADFDGYAEQLVVDCGRSLVVSPPTSEIALRESLEAQLGRRFEPPEEWNYGYPVHRMALGTKRAAEWLWLSPNRVRRGFVRSNDARYEELRHELPGFGLHYPELAESSLLLSTTDNAHSLVLAALRRLGMPAQELRDALTAKGVRVATDP